MAKHIRKKKKASKKKVARSATRRAAAPKRKGKAKTVAKKKKMRVVSKAKHAPRQKVTAKKTKKKAKASFTPKAKASFTLKAKETSGSTAAIARQTSREKTVKRKPAARRPPLDLRRFRQRLLARQSELLQAYISTKVDTRSREIDGTEDYIDYAVSSYDREFLLSLTELEQNELALVEAALKRLEAKEFGLCTQCERAIPTKRLEVQPWAQYCLRCQELADRGLSDEDDLPSDEDEADDESGQPIAADIDFEGDEPQDDDRLVEGG